MQERHAAQLLPRIGHLLQRAARPLYETMKSRVDGGHQQLVFVFEIQVDRAIGHPGTVGDLRHPGVKEPVLGNHLNGRIQDPLMLVRGPVA